MVVTVAGLCMCGLWPVLPGPAGVKPRRSVWSLLCPFRRSPRLAVRLLQDTHCTFNACYKIYIDCWNYVKLDLWHACVVREDVRCEWRVYTSCSNV